MSKWKFQKAEDVEEDLNEWDFYLETLIKDHIKESSKKIIEYLKEDASSGTKKPKGIL